MSALPVVAVIAAKPGSGAEVRAALESLVGPSRAEDGCLGYDLFESASAPGTFVTVELWRTQVDLDAHLQTPHIGAALSATGDHLATPPDIHPLVPVGN